MLGAPLISLLLLRGRGKRRGDEYCTRLVDDLLFSSSDLDVVVELLIARL